MNPARHLRALVSTWRGRFIVAFLAIQVLVPLHYYTVRHDPHDERFAWRMFSPMRMTKCSTQMKVAGQPVTLGTLFHEAWVEVAERGRFVVIEEMAEKLCRDNPGKPVDVSVDCAYLDRPPAHFGRDNICQAPEL